MTYARARLCLGITGVGTLVLLSAGAILVDAPGELLGPRPGEPPSLLGDVTAICALLAAYIAVGLPFDVLGGWLLPRLYQRTGLSFADWSVAWFRGVLVQSAVLALSAGALLAAARWGGPWAMLATAAAGMLTLLAAQQPLAELVGGLSRQPQRSPSETQRAEAELAESLRSLERLGLPRPSVTLLAGADVGFTGGAVGLPGTEQIVLPTRWVGALPTAVLTAELARRLGVLSTGTRTRGVLVAVGWNLAGLAVALLATGADPATVAGLVTVALAGTLWSFLGLLILPSLSRPGVLEADAFARRAGVPVEALRELMGELDRRQDDEPTRPAGVEAIFHPLPSVSRRAEALTMEAQPWGAWHAARLALFLSWAGMGLLSRAVHCNAGRPELWVLLPSD